MKDIIKKWKQYRKEQLPMYLVSKDGNMQTLSGNEPSFEDFMDWLAKTGRYTKDLPRM